MTATPEEIREYEETHGETHPIFRVEHRPERVPVGTRKPRFVDWSALTPAVTDQRGSE